MIPFALGAILAGAAVHTGANLYSQYQQRQIFKMQEADYVKQAADFKKNTGRDFAYPGLSAPGHARAARAGVNQSYASSVGSIGGFASSYGIGKSAGLYGNPGRAYRRN